jgi:FkbM family methyltransferase
MIRKIVRKFRASGVRGLQDAARRRLFSPTTPPIKIALDTLTQEDGFSVVQLGAFVGNSGNDPLFDTLCRRLREREGKLILVEPVKEFYDELVKNYEGVPGVEFENFAVSDRSGPATFYRLGVDPTAHGYPDWLSQLGSLKEERMTELWDHYETVKDLQEFYLAHRMEETVQCITYSELMDRHRLDGVDLLQIDVEGYELEVLRTIDFRKYPARFVNYERILLHQHRPAAEDLMRGWGYRLVDHGQDTFCFNTGDDNLRRKWSSLATRLTQP